MTEPRFPISTDLKNFCGLFGVDPTEVFIDAGVDVKLMNTRDAFAPASTHYQLWRSIEKLARARSADFAKTIIAMVESAEQSAFSPAGYAFCCSSSVKQGLERFGIFKRLLGPSSMNLEHQAPYSWVTFRGYGAPTDLPEGFALFEMIWVLHHLRRYSAQPPTHLRIEVPAPETVAPEFVAYFGQAPVRGRINRIRFISEELSGPPISLPAFAKPSFVIDEKMPDDFLGWVNRSIQTQLPTGDASLSAIANRLAMSKRSLQRRLTESGVSYSQLLDQTRRKLAKGYLASTTLRPEEISLLLAYKEPNSLYRAVAGWSGKSPIQWRAELRQDG